MQRRWGLAGPGLLGAEGRKDGQPACHPRRCCSLAACLRGRNWLRALGEEREGSGGVTDPRWARHWLMGRACPWSALGQRTMTDAAVHMVGSRTQLFPIASFRAQYVRVAEGCSRRACRHPGSDPDPSMSTTRDSARGRGACGAVASCCQHDRADNLWPSNAPVCGIDCALLHDDCALLQHLPVCWHQKESLLCIDSLEHPLLYII